MESASPPSRRRCRRRYRTRRSTHWPGGGAREERVARRGARLRRSRFRPREQAGPAAGALLGLMPSAPVPAAHSPTEPPVRLSADPLLCPPRTRTVLVALYPVPPAPPRSQIATRRSVRFCLRFRQARFPARQKVDVCGSGVARKLDSGAPPLAKQTTARPAWSGSARPIRDGKLQPLRHVRSRSQRHRARPLGRRSIVAAAIASVAHRARRRKRPDPPRSQARATPKGKPLV